MTAPRGGTNDSRWRITVEVRDRNGQFGVAHGRWHAYETHVTPMALASRILAIIESTSERHGEDAPHPVD